MEQISFFLKPGLHAFKMCLYSVPSDVEIVDQPGVDIFGQLYNQWKNKEVCVSNCNRSIAASRFAPHLEKCLGMGRNSSRIANRRSFISLFGEGNALKAVVEQNYLLVLLSDSDNVWTLLFYNPNSGNVGTFYFILIKWKRKDFQITWANIIFIIEHR